MELLYNLREKAIKICCSIKIDSFIALLELLKIAVQKPLLLDNVPILLDKIPILLNNVDILLDKIPILLNNVDILLDTRI